ncbi:MAG: TraB/GumN family protein [Fibrobacter sp.]|nr:TraB/GumN family protein [Fibrobacter sp.]
MWNKFCGTILFSAIFCLLLNACAGKRPVEKSPEPVCGEKHLLWKAEKSGAPAVWLLGSIHLADSSFYPFPSVIDSAFAASTLLAAELDLNEESTVQETAQLMAEKGRLPSGMTLEEVLPKNLYAQVDSLLQDWEIPFEIFKPFRPWMIAVSLSAMAIERTGLSGEYGIDVQLLAEANDLQKEIFAIETPAEQVNVFSNAEDSLGIQYLKNTLNEIAVADSFVNEIANAWKCGDANKMRDLLESDSSDDVYAEELYTKRNIRMAESIDSLASLGKKVFVVVGAAHLVGKDDNVLKLLDKRGYRIEQW